MKQSTLKHLFHLALGLSLSAVAINSAVAKTTASDAWARATVTGQGMGGAYVTLTSDRDAQLIGASSPVAQTVELHTMSLQGEKMIMTPVRSIDLPAHQAVALNDKYHLMFMGLKQALTEGTQVPIHLKIKLSSGYIETLSIQAPVKSLAHSAMH